jgi:predicted dienelactone hydrolase
MPKTRVGRILKGCGIVVIAGVLGVGALLSSLWLESRSEVTLPALTGPYAVGRVVEAWEDPGSTDPMAPAPGNRRELLVWIWYPASPAPGAARVEDYVPAFRPAAGTRTKPELSLFRWLTRDPSRVRPHSLRNADLAAEPPTYPVVIFRAGASAPVSNYTTLVEDLASHGYVVVAFDAAYLTGRVAFPDGRVIERPPENNPELYTGPKLERLADRLLAAWTADIAFALDRLEWLNHADRPGRFKGRLDLTRVGVFGHSLGGATAAQFCHQDPRCKAGIDIDGSLHGSVVQEGLRQPFFFLLSDHGDVSSDAESRKIYADLRSVYDRLPSEHRLLLSIRGANHFTFSDDGALLKSRLLRWVMRALGKLDIDGRRQLAVTTYCVHRFFDAYLKEPGATRPELASPRYPEIQVVH